MPPSGRQAADPLPSQLAVGGVQFDAEPVATEAFRHDPDRA
jgi:hypothetical protein